jgi:hypothetical protein
MLIYVYYLWFSKLNLYFHLYTQLYTQNKCNVNTQEEKKL